MSAPVHNAVSGVETGAKAEPKGRYPHQRRMRAVLWIVFVSASLTPDLTSGLKGASRVSQKCTEREHRRTHASVSGGRTWVPHVILRCRAVVAAAHRTPRSINHTYRFCACVCDSGANTCYQSGPGRAARPSADVFTCLRAHMWTRTCAPTKEQRWGGWLIGQRRLGGHYKEDGGKRVATRRQRAWKKDK